LSSDNEVRISEAVILHRKGRVAEAKAIYESVLREDAHNANAVGLLGIVAIQEGDRRKAEALWTQSLKLASAPFVYIRNLNNLAATLFEDGRDVESVSHLENAEIPNWAGARPPDETELKSIMSLALCLQRANLGKKLRALLEPVALMIPSDRDAMRFLAATRFDDGDYAQALEILTTFNGDDDLWVMTTRLDCAAKLGRRQEAEAECDRVVKFAPVYISEPFHKDLKTVLVINSTERIVSTNLISAIHFNANFASQIAGTLEEKFNFISVFPDGDHRSLGGIKPDLVLNNVVNAEMLSRDHKQKVDLSVAAEAFGVPVINHPMQAALTTRQRTAFWLTDVENVRPPRTIRFKALDNDANLQIRFVEEKIGYPHIIRPTFTHSGVDMTLIETRDGLIRELQIRGGQQIYVHEFIENRTIDGLFRKIRVAVIGDEIVPVMTDFDEYWNVHGRTKPHRKEFYRRRRHLLELDRQILREPNEVLTTGVMETLREIRKKIPLDIFGIDFDVMSDGTVLFFEANAAMNFFGLFGPENADIERPEDAFCRANEAIARYFLRVPAR
jgi:glutathione synthase/RimK-type ligase-like ATP-grasp enzyme/Tfp pilus assembly protein PilF